MQIHELPVGSPASGVQFAGDTGSQTQKIDYDALADAILNKLTTKTFDIKSESQTIIAALNALGDASKQDVANNLVTTAAGLVLDARQGKALKDLHDSNASSIASLNSSLGTIYSEDGTVSVVNGTFTTVCTLSLPAGIYVITGDIAFSGTETTGIRILILDTAETGSNSYSNSTLATGRADIGKTRIVGLTGSTTLYLRAYQTSGGTIICNGRIRAIRIK